MRNEVDWASVEHLMDLASDEEIAGCLGVSAALVAKRRTIRRSEALNVQGGDKPSTGLFPAMRKRISWTEELREQYLEKLATCGSIVRSLEACRLHQDAIALARKNDPALANDEAIAQEYFSATVEAELIRRAIEGEPEAVFHQGMQTATIIKKSDPLLLALAKAKVSCFQDKLNIAATVRSGVLVVPAEASSDEDFDKAFGK
jgi:hypothetical protein